ncbi:hypothetical protein FQN54_001482 [Arachnomyces sp. PD_36]|nr:hypothetical protein FQN54_001482 [Arachnomyces sp. PD_36]
MTSPLLRCPTDILRLVLGHLSSADLHATLLTNKALQLVAEPFLYADIRLDWGRTKTPPIVGLLRSILQRPELATFIRNLTLNGDDIEFNLHQYRRESPKLSVSESDLDCLFEGTEKLNVPYFEMWAEELCLGTMDAFVALLISQLPNLRSLYLDKNFTRRSCFVGMMFRSALCERPKDCHLPYFEHLLEVSPVYYNLGIDIRRYTKARNTADILPFFYLPSVKRITALIDNPTTFEWPATPPDSSTLESLDLTMIREGNLGQILSVTTGLKTLRWKWYYRDDLRDQFVTDIIDLDQIATELSHVRETLADLTITVQTAMCRADPEFPPVEIKGPFRAFSDLSVLRKLDVPLPLLMGLSGASANLKDLSKALPRGIEYLTITDGMCLQEEWEWEDADLLEAVRFWLGDWKQSTPRLQVFHLFIGILDYGNWGPEIRQELKDVGAQAGIQVKITKLAGEM